MVAWKRFPIPEFDHNQFKEMRYVSPATLSLDQANALVTKYTADQSGGHVVMPAEELFDRFQIRGEHRHAVMCLLPSLPVHLLGRSWAWKIQRALILDSLDPGSAKVLYDWKTPRPINTRLGPDEGETFLGTVCYVITANKFADHWLGNRSILDMEWDAAGVGRKGFRILGSSEPDTNDFHDTYLAFDWQV
jgi:hypothetical protein